MKDAPPDLVLSGVNRGHNVAEDTVYSGTVGARWRRRSTGCARRRCRSTSGRRTRAAADPFAAAWRHRRGAASGGSMAAELAGGALRGLLQRQLPAGAGRGEGRPRHLPGLPAAPTFEVLPPRRAERPHLSLTDPRARQRRRARGLGLARVPRRLHHRDAAQRRPHRARAHRAACTRARIGRGSFMHPAERQMQFVFTPCARAGWSTPRC